MLFNLSDHPSIASRFLLELRDQRIQKDRMRFRKNLERLGEVIAYEISKTLAYRSVTVPTSLGTSHARDLTTPPVLISILRAGVPFLQGFLNFFDEAPTGFIGAYRLEENDQVEIKMEYAATPEFDGKEVILVDPMLATGGSIIRALEYMLKRGKPSRVHVAVVIAAPEGIASLQKFFEAPDSCPYHIWTAAIDDKLNQQFYIVPGLGDAGDLSFGAKID